MKMLVQKGLNFLYRFRSEQPGPVQRVLLLFPSGAVGDTVIETFFIHEIKKLYPQAQLEVAMLAPYALLLKDNPDVSRIYKMPVFPLKKLIWLTWKVFFFRTRHYDLLLDLPHNGYAPFRQLWLYFIRAAKTLSCNAIGYDFITYPLSWTEGVPRHITQEVYVKALKLLGAAGPFDVKYYLSLPQTAVEVAKKFLADTYPASSKILLLNPEGSQQPRTLTVQRTRELAQLLVQQTIYKVVVLSHKQTYTALPQRVHVFRSADLLETAALVSLVDYVVTVDTGILHIADAFNKPMTALFSEANRDDSPRPYVEYVWGSKNPQTRCFKARYSVNDIKPAAITSILKDREETCLPAMR
ncbi:MAG: glycosyltransferase family 9 protein [Elusimicrobiaceae bacterium]|nr:glycosyltransferase family 9 protein [Elusimicrobiaceae bacterium]